MNARDVMLARRQRTVKREGEAALQPRCCARKGSWACLGWCRPLLALVTAAAPVSVGLAGCRCEALRMQPDSSADLESRGEPPAKVDRTPAAAHAGDATPATASLLDELREARKGQISGWQAPSTSELEAHGQWIGTVVSAALSDRVPDGDAPAGFVRRSGDSGRLWFLQERASTKRGAGFVAVRRGASRRIIVEVPHSFYDAGTLEIGVNVFEGMQAMALLVNTMHRGGPGDAAARKAAAESGQSEYDVAHHPVTFFLKAHEALVALDPRVQVVQLHGFADERVPGVQAVVSAAGTQADTRAVAAALGAVWPGGAVRVFPEEIDILGGTTNVQAGASRRLGARLLHLELSASARQALRGDARLLGSFTKALRSALDEAP